MINRIILIGRLVADPEIRYTQNGISFMNGTIAVERSFKDEGGNKQVDFIPIVAWRKTAELIGQYLKKGSILGVDGSLQMRKYQTKEGENRTVYEVLVERVQFLDGSQSKQENTSSPPDHDAPPPSDNNGELPF